MRLLETRACIDAGEDRRNVAACEEGMRLVGERYEAAEGITCRRIMAGDLREVLEIAQPALQASLSVTQRKVLIGTVRANPRYRRPFFDRVRSRFRGGGPPVSTCRRRSSPGDAEWRRTLSGCPACSLARHDVIPSAPAHDGSQRARTDPHGGGLVMNRCAATSAVTRSNAGRRAPVLQLMDARRRTTRRAPEIDLLRRDAALDKSSVAGLVYGDRS